MFVILITAIIGPFIREKISRDLHKTRLKKDASLTVYTSLLNFFYSRRVLSKTPAHILYRLHAKLASYVSRATGRALYKSRFILSRLNGPNVLTTV